MDIETYRSLYSTHVSSRDVRLPKVSFEDFCAGVTACESILSDRMDQLQLEVLMAHIGTKSSEVFKCRIKHLEKTNAALLAALSQLSK